MTPYVMRPFEPGAVQVYGRTNNRFHGDVVRNKEGWIIRMPNGKQQARLVVPPTGRDMKLTMDQLMELSPMKGKHLIHKVVLGFGRGRILHFRTRQDAAEFAYLNY